MIFFWGPGYNGNGGPSYPSVGFWSVQNGTPDPEIPNLRLEDQGKIKYWAGADFIAKPIKYYNGTTWVIRPLKRYNGTTWVTTDYYYA